MSEELKPYTWYVTKWTSHNHVHVSEFDGNNMVFIADFGDPTTKTLPHNKEAEKNAIFLETCHATCCAINANNPQIVAENIKTLVDILNEISHIPFIGGTFSITGEHLPEFITMREDRYMSASLKAKELLDKISEVE